MRLSLYILLSLVTVVVSRDCIYCLTESYEKIKSYKHDCDSYWCSNPKDVCVKIETYDEPSKEYSVFRTCAEHNACSGKSDVPVSNHSLVKGVGKMYCCSRNSCNGQQTIQSNFLLVNLIPLLSSILLK